MQAAPAASAASTFNISLIQDVDLGHRIWSAVRIEGGQRSGVDHLGHPVVHTAGECGALLVGQRSV